MTDVRPGQFPPAPPPSPREDTKLTADEVRRRIAAMKALLPVAAHPGRER